MVVLDAVEEVEAAVKVEEDETFNNETTMEQQMDPLKMTRHDTTRHAIDDDDWGVPPLAIGRDWSYVLAVVEEAAEEAEATVVPKAVDEEETTVEVEEEETFNNETTIFPIRAEPHTCS